MTPDDWAALNLEPGRLARLLAVGEALTRIGRLRTGEPSGQLSIHNFSIRAAYDEEGALVVLMRAGVWRRHTWFCAVRDESGEVEVALPRSMDSDWDWWLGVEEVGGRLVASEVWEEAVSESLERLRAGYEERLRGARVLMGEGRLPVWDGSDSLPD